ncbi:MAG: TonB family protein [Bacteroidales bacterium]|nr:TonB family protein [Bacteroidales bacterium]
MELKKSTQADLENKKGVFFVLGLSLVLGVLLLSFEWTTGEVEVQDLGSVQDALFEAEEIPITRQQEIEPPKIDLPKPQVVDQIEIVKDDAKVADVDIQDSEADDKTAVKVVEVAKVEEEDEKEEEIFVVVETMPEFPGGITAMRKFIAENLEYPEIAREMGVQGKVIVQFVVDKTGKVTNAVVARGIDPSLDKAALKVVNSMPSWKAGKQRGEPVRVKYTLPVSFVLN